MKIYIVQEDFGYYGENACGEEEYSANSNIIGVCLNKDDALRMIEKAVKSDLSEYYTVDANDYKVVVADTDTGDVVTTLYYDEK